MKNLFAQLLTRVIQDSTMLERPLPHVQGCTLWNIPQACALANIKAETMTFSHSKSWGKHLVSCEWISQEAADPRLAPKLSGDVRG